MLPNVTGKAGEVILVLDNDLYSSNIGKEFKRHLVRDYPGLPQPEPLFDLIQIPYQAFTSIFKTHRNVLIVRVSDEYKEPKMIIQKDLYAKPQMVINILAPNNAALESLIADKGELIVDRLLKMETSRYAKNYIKYQEKKVTDKIVDKFNIEISFPKGYAVDMDTTDFVWVASDSPTTTQSVLVFTYKRPQVDLTTPYLVAKRNEFTKQFVAGPNANSYMTIESEMEPFRREIEVNNIKVIELRGLWRVEGDFMGGPFITFVIDDVKNNRVIHVDGFVYAPQFKKRDYIRQLEAILHSIKLV
ncbi:MAG: hypothetical protein A2X00_05360 [Bacteroidetes bacterium GWE2_32_14]|nr:MAG: hypothetical protein A2X00_05360 [Bacteroidetes bacterium GWE2_32_14]